MQADHSPTPPPIDEPLLVLRARNGDPAAFEQLVDRYHRRIHYYLRKMLPAAAGDRADDAAQQLWIDVYRSLAGLRDPAAFAPWLYRLARDRAYRDLRRTHRHRESPVEHIELTDDAPPVDDDILRAEDATRVHAALDRLSPEHREALLLRFVECLDYAQIAHAIGCELGTVRSRLHYAKRALKDLLEQETDHDAPRRPPITTA